MKNLNIESYSGSVPKVQFDVNTGICEISGESCPEDVHIFYDELNDWLYDYIENIKGHISLIINLKYFNTSSSRAIFRILLILKKFPFDF